MRRQNNRRSQRCRLFIIRCTSYTFGSGGFLNGKKPSEYLGENPKPTDVMIQIFHTNKGKVVALNFAKDGYMVTMVDGKETTCIYDGNSLKSEG